MSTISRRMTEAEFLALPEEEGISRELIRGELRERPMTTRNVPHSVVIMNVGHRLKLWMTDQPEPKGLLIGGEARVRLRRDQPTFVGVDVAYVGPETRPVNSRKAKFIDGPPLLVVEVLSTHDETDDIADKVSEYLDAGVPIVWIINPRFSTVTVHRSDAKPQLFNADQVITAEPHLPGLRIAVKDLFEGLDD